MVFLIASGNLRSLIAVRLSTASKGSERYLRLQLGAKVTYTNKIGVKKGKKKKHNKLVIDDSFLVAQ